MVKKVQNFFSEVMVEMKKVSWPNAEELRGSTTVVLVAMLALAAFIGVVDFVMSQTLHMVLR